MYQEDKQDLLLMKDVTITQKHSFEQVTYMM